MRKILNCKAKKGRFRGDFTKINCSQDLFVFKKKRKKIIPYISI